MGGVILLVGSAVMLFRGLVSRRARSTPVVLGNEGTRARWRVGDEVRENRRARRDVEQSPAKPAKLFWNLRFSGSENLANAASVAIHAIHYVETAIEARRGGERTRGLDAELVVGRTVTFELIGEGIELRSGRGQQFRHSILSRPMACGESGTLVFAAEWKATRSGPVFMTAVLAVLGSVLKDITVWFDAQNKPTAPAGPPRSMEVPVDPSELSRIEQSDLVLHAIRRDQLLELTLEQPSRGVDHDADNAIADTDGNSLNNLVLIVRNDLELLSGAYPQESVHDLTLPDDAALQSVAKHGHKLYEAMFGAIGEGHPALDTVNAALRAAPMGARLAIDDGGAAVPWGILYDGDLESIDVERFWGTRFRISRRVVTVDPSIVATAAIDAAGVQANDRPVLHSFVNPNVVADVFTHQVAMEATLESVVDIGLRGRSSADLRAWMTPGQGWVRCDLLYLFAHATVTGTVAINGVPNSRWPDANSVLDLDSARDADLTAGVTVEEMTALRRSHGRLQPLPDHPIAIVNACSSGRADAQCLLNPLVKLFVKRWGMPVFVGTDWATPQRFAAPFAEALLTNLTQAGVTAGEALWTATRVAVVEHGNPFALNYCLYGRPDCTLVSDLDVAQ